MSSSGDDITQGFRFVREVYRNVSRMLRASDEVVEKYGFVPYRPVGQRWRPFERTNDNIAEPDGWVPTMIVRQFYPQHAESRAVLTVATVLLNDVLDAPLALASYMRIKADPPSVLWLGLLQAWHGEDAPFDGVVRPVKNSIEQFSQEYAAALSAPVIHSVAVSLVTITSNNEVERLLVQPLVEELRRESILPR